MRNDHYLRISLVRFPQNNAEKEIWAKLLGIKDVLTVKDGDRVSVVHFFEVDYILCEGESKSLVFESIPKNEITKYQISNTGSSSLTAPPRPAATVKDLLHSHLYKKLKVTYSDYMEERKAIKSASMSSA